MVGPIPFSPFTREVIVDAGDHYERGTFSWWSRSVTFYPDQIPKNSRRGRCRGRHGDIAHPRVSRVVTVSVWTIERRGHRTRRVVTDMRFPDPNGPSSPPRSYPPSALSLSTGQ